MTADGTHEAEDGDDREPYVHEPGALDESAATDSRSTQPRNDPGQVHTDAEFDWRGWVLVAAVVFAFLVVPLSLYYLSAVRAAVAGLGFRSAYLVLPLLPALVLATVAVWSAVRSRTG